MNVLILGGEKGSWQMRGHQLGAAVGARVTTNPRPADWEWAHLIVLVKRAIDQWGKRAVATGRPLIWDVLDFWQQPDDNGRAADFFLNHVRSRQAAHGVRLLFGATRVMAEDIGGVYLSHHSRLGLRPLPPRRQLSMIAYEGTPKYLGAWQGALERASQRLGAQFVMNPPSLTDADVVVAFRGERWDGWACRNWKSGVKCVNALVAGRPIVTQDSAGYREVKPVGMAIEDPGHLEEALISAWLMSDDAFRLGRRLAADFTVDTVAAQYRLALRGLIREAA